MNPVSSFCCDYRGFEDEACFETAEYFYMMDLNAAGASDDHKHIIFCRCRHHDFMDGSRKRIVSITHEEAVAWKVHGV